MQPFSDFQYGFSPFHSTADLLILVSNKITKAFNRSGVTWVVALDISKAFGSAWNAGLLHGLQSFLSNRQFQVALNGASLQEYPVNADALQGSMLDRALFLLYIYDFSNDVFCNFVVCVDDITFDLWQQLELASELVSDLRDIVDCSKNYCAVYVKMNGCLREKNFVLKLYDCFSLLSLIWAPIFSL